MGRYFFACLTCAIGLCGSASPALAEDHASPNEPTVVVVKRWYGWQPLTCDGLALTSFVIGGETARGDRPQLVLMEPAFAVAGASLYFACGPTVHLLHGHPLRALGDFGIRVALPGVPLLVAAAAIAASRGNQATDNSRDTGPGLTIGAFVLPLVIVGAAGAVAIDATRLSREEKRVVIEEHASRSFHITPDFSLRRGGGSFGLRGSF